MRGAIEYGRWSVVFCTKLLSILVLSIDVLCKDTINEQTCGKWYALIASIGRHHVILTLQRLALAFGAVELGKGRGIFVFDRRFGL